MILRSIEMLLIVRRFGDLQSIGRVWCFNERGREDTAFHWRLLTGILDRATSVDCSWWRVDLRSCNV